MADEGQGPSGPGRTLYVVGQINEREVTGKSGPVIERDVDIVGVFTTRDAAVAQCTGPTHFVGPVTEDEPLPQGKWPGIELPYLGATEADLNLYAEQKQAEAEGASDG